MAVARRMYGWYAVNGEYIHPSGKLIARQDPESYFARWRVYHVHNGRAKGPAGPLREVLRSVVW